MLADLLEVHTRTFHSIFNDSTARTVRIERMGALAFVTESAEGPIGTKIRIRVKADLNERYESLAGSVYDYLWQIVIRPAIDLEINLGGKQVLFASKRQLVLTESGPQTMADLHLEAVHIELGAFSDLISGDVVLFFYRHQDGTLSHRWEEPSLQIQIGQRGLEPWKFYENYHGNLVAVNGFRMSLRKMAKLLGLGKERIPLIFEININAEHDIAYDVAPDQVIGEGRFKVAVEFREALLRAVAELKLSDRLQPATKTLLDKITTIKAADFVRARGYLDVDEHQLAEAIQQLVSSKGWRKGMEKGIADRLNLPVQVVVTVVNRLIDEGGLIVRPE